MFVLNIDTVSNMIITLLDANLAALASSGIVLGILTVGIALIETTWAAPDALVVAWTTINACCRVTVT